MVAKPSEQAPASTLVFAELFAEAGFPPGVFNVVTGAVWTKDVHRGHRVAAGMRAGSVWINAYTETNAVWVELTGGTRDPFTLD